MILGVVVTFAGDSTGTRLPVLGGVESWQSGSSMLRRSGVQTTSSLEEAFRRFAGGAGDGLVLFGAAGLPWLRLETFDSRLSPESDILLGLDLAKRQQLLLSLSICRRISSSGSGKP